MSGKLLAVGEISLSGNNLTLIYAVVAVAVVAVPSLNVVKLPGIALIGRTWSVYVFTPNNKSFGVVPSQRECASVVEYCDELQCHQDPPKPRIER